MKNQFTAEGFLNLLIAILLVGVIALGGFGYYAFDQSAQRSVTALQAGRDLGAAVATARAADATARLEAATFEQLATARAPEPAASGAAPAPVPAVRTDLLRKQDEALRKQLDEVSALFAARGADAGRLEEAGRVRGRLLEQYETRLKMAAPDASPVGEKWADIAPAVEAAAQQQAGTFGEESGALTRRVAMLMGFLVLLGIAVAMQLRNWIRRANGRPLKAATQVVEQIAAGDLTVKAEGMDQAHTRRLAVALDEMTSSLRTLASEVVASARTVADTSAQIAQGNLDLSQRTEEQASTLEETASSMEELTSTVQQNADNAREASQFDETASTEIHTLALHDALPISTMPRCRSWW